MGGDPAAAVLVPAWASGDALRRRRGGGRREGRVVAGWQQSARVALMGDASGLQAKRWKPTNNITKHSYSLLDQMCLPIK